MKFISIPTRSALISDQLVPSTHPAVNKLLYRLSRSALLSLVLDWLDERNQENIAPYVLRTDEIDDDQELYTPCSSLLSLREHYIDLQSLKGSKRDVTDRIIEGDWRNGLSLYQLAMADMQYLYDHPSSQKWTAFKIVRLSPSTSEDKMPSLPRFHPATFLRNLQREVLPDIKAHYNLDRHSTLPLLILRIFILESPYNTSLALTSTKSKPQAMFDSSKTFYVAFPDASPYIYVSLATTPYLSAALGPSPTTSDSQSLRRLLLEVVPKAFSRPRERYKLESTSLSARNLDALVERRGGGRGNAAAGGWGLYALDDRDGKDNPLNRQLPAPEMEVVVVGKRKELGLKRKRSEDEGMAKRRKMVAWGRFGESAKVDDGKGIERLDIRLDESFPITESVDEVASEVPAADRKKSKGRRSTISLQLDRIEDEDITGEGWRPDLRVTFHGQHIFAGIRELVEAGIIDGENMPGWMTGEEGVSVGIVRDGRIRGYKGSGL